VKANINFYSHGPAGGGGGIAASQFGIHG